MKRTSCPLCEREAGLPWGQIREQINVGDTVVGVCCRLPVQEEEADEVF